jgi:ribosomal protein L37AE/L43A
MYWFPGKRSCSKLRRRLPLMLSSLIATHAHMSLRTVHMTSPLQLVQTPRAVFEIEPDVPHGASCPSCHTARAGLVDDAGAGGGEWQCVRCGQHWDAARLAAVAAYAVWVVDYDSRRRARRAAEK